MTTVATWLITCFFIVSIEVISKKMSNLTIRARLPVGLSHWRHSGGLFCFCKCPLLSPPVHQGEREKKINKKKKREEEEEEASMPKIKQLMCNSLPSTQ
jgi:hypothetical protein